MIDTEANQLFRYRYFTIHRGGMLGMIVMSVTSLFTVTCCGVKLYCFDDTVRVYICPVGIPSKEKYPKLLVNAVCVNPPGPLIVTIVLKIP